MSNTVRYDSLLVKHLARELDGRLRGRAAAALRFDADARRASLELDGGALVLDLHPLRGWILEGTPAPAPDIRRLHRSARVGRVHAPADERVLRLEFDGSTSESRPVRSLVVELLTNQLDAFALDDDGRIVVALWPRRAGARDLRAGRIYAPPAADPREGRDHPLPRERFDEIMVAAAASADDGSRRRPVPPIAYLSALNRDAIASHDDYLELVWGDPRPCVVRRRDGGSQPYPRPLGADSHPAESLLAAMLASAGAAATLAPPSLADPETLDRIRREITRTAARVERMESQRARALPQASALRARADLLLARLHEVPRGAARVSLIDFEGNATQLELDPARSPSENATALYDAARKRERASERIPALVDDARGRIRSLETLLARAERGEVEPAELEARLPRSSTTDAKGEETLLPYRRYTTSGGLEVRVGRSGRANDDLTFRHSSPNDIWMHARDVAGAHVILRWPHADGGPPQRDLAEAAVLAALHSRARTSGTVPVDWTRRKYVRKPRKAPPGAVLPERVKTVFVEPDEAVERRLRGGGLE